MPYDFEPEPYDPNERVDNTIEDIILFLETKILVNYPELLTKEKLVEIKRTVLTSMEPYQPALIADEKEAKERLAKFLEEIEIPLSDDIIASLKNAGAKTDVILKNINLYLSIEYSKEKLTDLSYDHSATLISACKYKRVELVNELLKKRDFEVTPNVFAEYKKLLTKKNFILDEDAIKIYFAMSEAYLKYLRAHPNEGDLKATIQAIYHPELMAQFNTINDKIIPPDHLSKLIAVIDEEQNAKLLTTLIKELRSVGDTYNKENTQTNDAFNALFESAKKIIENRSYSNEERLTRTIAGVVALHNMIIETNKKSFLTFRESDIRNLAHSLRKVLVETKNPELKAYLKDKIGFNTNLIFTSKPKAARLTDEDWVDLGDDKSSKKLPPDAPPKAKL